MFLVFPLILFIFTSSYPYDSGAEQTFLEEEVRILQEKFERIILVPRDCVGTKLSLPGGVEADESYARLLVDRRVIALLRAFFSSHFYSDLITRPSILFHLEALIRLIKYIGKADLARRWVEAWLAHSSVSARDCMFYTYWFDDASMGIGLSRAKIRDVRVVSRAHGYDLYEERYDFPYWPCRRTAISLMDRIFPDSEAGLRYLQARYPEFGEKYETSLLGVLPSGFTARPSQDGALRIVSCSKIVPVKRVELLIEGIANAARRRSDVHFYWCHMGNGSMREKMQARANEIFPSNARGILPGYESQQALFDFYRNTPVDVFVNVSASEGTPVAVMEAVSCGIPVIATAVGGNVEIVSSLNGVLLFSIEPTPDEIASALLEIYENPDAAEKKRKESFRVWKEKYNAATNYTKFSESLVHVCHDGA